MEKNIKFDLLTRTSLVLQRKIKTKNKYKYKMLNYLFNGEDIVIKKSNGKNVYKNRQEIRWIKTEL